MIVALGHEPLFADQSRVEFADAIHQVAVFMRHRRLEDFVVRRIAGGNQGGQRLVVAIVALHVSGAPHEMRLRIMHDPFGQVK